MEPLLLGGMRPSRYTTGSSSLPIAEVITLDQVRPQLRKQNEYVDTPRTNVPLLPTKAGIHGSVSIPVAGSVVSRERVLLPSRTSSTLTAPTIVSTQPISTSPPLKKDLASINLEIDDSIICSRCGKCRCGACTSPQELPSNWLCRDTVNLTPDSVVDQCTCMCLVRGCFYHCDEQDKDFEEVSEDPCACCSRPHCCKRWTCMLAASLCLPCLCLYWPARCGLLACTACYNKCRRKGCTCKNNTSQASSKSKLNSRSGKLDSGSQYRGLLFESESSSNS